MSQVKDGDKVKVHYTGRLADGVVFDTSEDRDPLVFTIGEAQVIRGFEREVVGMAPGETKEFKLSPEEAYGPRDDQMVFSLDRGEMPADLVPQVGQRLELKPPEGQPIGATVTDVNEQAVTVDANHPLAGRDLTFEVRLLEVA